MQKNIDTVCVLHCFTIILLAGPWFVLTAAHCFISNTKLIVYAGIVDLEKLTEVGPSYQAIRADKNIPHPKYNPDYNNYDIGIIKLAFPLKLNSKHKTLVTNAWFASENCNSTDPKQTPSSTSARPADQISTLTCTCTNNGEEGKGLRECRRVKCPSETG
jgi:secreted trypsin-like serine protease